MVSSAHSEGGDETEHQAPRAWQLHWNKPTAELRTVIVKLKGFDFAEYGHLHTFVLQSDFVLASEGAFRAFWSRVLGHSCYPQEQARGNLFPTSEDH